MKVKKGQLLDVNHTRSGKWRGIATADFDTDKETFFPIALYQKGAVNGMATIWKEGDLMPCRNILCTITKVKK